MDDFRCRIEIGGRLSKGTQAAVDNQQQPVRYEHLMDVKYRVRWLLGLRDISVLEAQNFDLID